MKSIIKLLIITISLFPVYFGYSQTLDTLNNKELIKLTKAKMGDDFIINFIQTRPSKFDCSPSAFIYLKKQHVSEKVISEVLKVCQKTTLLKDTIEKRNDNSIKKESIVSSQDTEGCEKKKTGDFCFYNGYKKQLTLNFYYYTVYEIGGDSRPVQSDIILKPGESKCIYNVYTSYPGKFTAVEIDDPNTKEYENPKTIDMGDFIAEKCKSKNYSIK